MALRRSFLMNHYQPNGVHCTVRNIKVRNIVIVHFVCCITLKISVAAFIADEVMIMLDGEQKSLRSTL